MNYSHSVRAGAICAGMGAAILIAMAIVGWSGGEALYLLFPVANAAT